MEQKLLKVLKLGLIRSSEVIGPQTVRPHL